METMDLSKVVASPVKQHPLYGRVTMYRRKDANRKHQTLRVMTKEEFNGLFQ